MTIPSAHDAHQWWPLVAAGDEKAFTALYHAYSPHVFQVAMLYTRQDIDLAEEFVQEVFIRVWEKRSTLAGVVQGEDFFFILARNLIFDHFKKTAREAQRKKLWLAEPGAPDQSAGQSLDARETQALLSQAIAALPPQQRRVYTLAKEQELTMEQIAAQLEISPYTVRTHLKLATRFIRGYVRERLPVFLLILLLGPR
jgi:RNA polymerase sigma-70 factor (family 1)